MKENNDSSPMSGWIGFAAVMMMLAGVFQGFVGLAAIFKPTTYFVTYKDALLVWNYSTWGWAHLLIGIVLFLSAFSLLAGKLWGRIVAITMALLSAIANFGFIKAYPIWSILIIVIDVMVIMAVFKYSASSAED